MRQLWTTVLLLALSFAHVIALERAAEESHAYSRENVHAFVMPSQIIKIATLDYDGLASDYMLLKGIILLGSVSERKNASPILEPEWKWVYRVLDAASNLDPYFYDPYYFANAYLPWYGGMTKEANSLLEKGVRYRDWDWILPFFIGFNQFYFLHEDDKAAESFMEASRRPGANPSLANIAAKLAYHSNKTENAIYFFEQMLSLTNDVVVQNEYKNRIRLYSAVLYLERALIAYTAKFNTIPEDLNALIKKGLIKQLPVDPYGGKFYLDEQGMISTTSGVIMLRKKS